LHGPSAVAELLVMLDCSCVSLSVLCWWWWWWWLW